MRLPVLTAASSRLLILALPLANTPLAAQPGFPAGWGGGPASYVFGMAPAQNSRDKLALTIKPGPDTPAKGFGTLTRCIPAGDYPGQRLRLRARLKAPNGGRAQLWMRVDANKVPVNFYNMNDRPVRNTSDWQPVQVVLDVPQGSTKICYGFFLNGRDGEAWADDIALETVGTDVPASKSSMAAGTDLLPPAPVPLGAAAVAQSNKGWHLKRGFRPAGVSLYRGWSTLDMENDGAALSRLAAARAARLAIRRRTTIPMAGWSAKSRSKPGKTSGCA